MPWWIEVPLFVLVAGFFLWNGIRSVRNDVDWPATWKEYLRQAREYANMR